MRTTTSSPSRHFTEVSRVKLAHVDGLPVRVADIAKAVEGKSCRGLALLQALVTTKGFVLESEVLRAFYRFPWETEFMKVKSMARDVNLILKRAGL